MYLYVWEGAGVLTDYTNGMVVALANNLDEAIKVIEETEECAVYTDKRSGEQIWNIPKYPTKVVDLATANPQAYVVWGGS